MNCSSNLTSGQRNQFLTSTQLQSEAAAVPIGQEAQETPLLEKDLVNCVETWR